MLPCTAKLVAIRSPQSRGRRPSATHPESTKTSCTNRTYRCTPTVRWSFGKSPKNRRAIFYAKRKTPSVPVSAKSSSSKLMFLLISTRKTSKSLHLAISKFTFSATSRATIRSTSSGRCKIPSSTSTSR
uniref:(northern house mosquito) hypothetical protein n=1 Tax=Culex pipiens TaxID=7175 RepID=A0A8D8BZ10_CULPI